MPPSEHTAAEPAPFTVHVDPDELARRSLATAVPVEPFGVPDGPGPDRANAAPRGARRPAARTRVPRTGAAGTSRSYAFRRS